MKVLYFSHTGLVGGAERSLLTLVAAMDRDSVAGIACPAGPLADRAKLLGVRWLPIRGTTASLKLHPRRTIRAFGELARMGTDVHRAANAAGADVIHANNLRTGIAGAIARRLGHRPLVVHLRDCLPDSYATRLIRSVVLHEAETLVAISRFVADCFMSGLSGARGSSNIHILDNPVDIPKFPPPIALPREQTDQPVLAIIGQISSWKGHETAIRALPRVRDLYPRARLLIVGEVKFDAPATRLDNHAYRARLDELIQTLGLSSAVRFMGERDDIPQLMSELTVLLVPSIAEPFGRTVAEAMVAGVPVVATNSGGPAELLDDHRTGRLVPPGDTAAWSAAILETLGDPARAHKRAVQARVEALARFSAERHAARISEVHRGALRRG